MGTLFSSPCLEHTNTLFPEGRHFPYHGNPAPEEASRTPEDSKTYYADFYEKACCAPHRDGRQVIVYWIPDEQENWRETPAWAVKRLRKMYNRLSSDHPRIVRYNGILDGAIGGAYEEKIGGLLLEKLTPGPIYLMALPALETPTSATSNPNDMLVLSLYYRWALQALSAISFFHRHGIFLRVFTSQMVWLRSDFSMPITGFINAITKSDYPYTESTEEYLRNQTSKEYYDELPREDDGMVFDESMRYEENGREIPGVKEDLFEWATFVWRLMTTGEDSGSYGSCEPNSPRSGDPIADYGQNKDTLEVVIRQRDIDGPMWQELEEQRMGKVLVKAWNGKYESVGDVMEDVKAMAMTIGVTVVGDEVDIGTAWKDVLEVVERKVGIWKRELRLRTPVAAHTEGWIFV